MGLIGEPMTIHNSKSNEIRETCWILLIVNSIEDYLHGMYNTPNDSRLQNEIFCNVCEQKAFLGSISNFVNFFSCSNVDQN